MKFGPVPIAQAQGKILGHNIAGPNGRRLLRKGRALSGKDIQTLRDIGRKTVYVAELAPDDVGENEAARRVAAELGCGLRLVGPSAGRVNLLATGLGILRVDVERLYRINQYEGITIATLQNHTPVHQRQIVATVKIIPFAVPQNSVCHVESIANSGNRALISIDMLTPKRVSMIFSGAVSIHEKLNRDFQPLKQRIENLGSEITTTDYIPLEDESSEVTLAETLDRRRAAGAQLIVLAGETAIMDRHDIVPRALERAGGRVECLGVPVDPGNLLMLGYLEGVPVLGAPGCARSHKTNIVDWVLPRLLAGDHLTRADFIPLGHGGLLEDTPKRPMPRARVQ